MPAMVSSNIGAYVGGEEVTHSDSSAPHRGVCQCILKTTILAGGELAIRTKRHARELFCAPALTLSVLAYANVTGLSARPMIDLPSRAGDPARTIDRSSVRFSPAPH